MVIIIISMNRQVNPTIISERMAVSERGRALVHALPMEWPGNP